MCDAPFYSPSLNYPVNVYHYGLLFVFNNLDYSIQQIYIPHQRYQVFNNSFAYRMKWDNTQDFGEWIYLSEYDYSSISLSIAGYIVFLNGLVLQWGVPIYPGTMLEVIYPITTNGTDVITFANVRVTNTDSSFTIHIYNHDVTSCELIVFKNGIPLTQTLYAGVNWVGIGMIL